MTQTVLPLRNWKNSQSGSNFSIGEMISLPLTDPILHLGCDRYLGGLCDRGAFVVAQAALGPTSAKWTFESCSSDCHRDPRPCRADRRGDGDGVGGCFKDVCSACHNEGHISRL